MLKIRKNDVVIVKSGRDKGKTGEVLKVFPRDNKIIVKDVGVVKKHQKQTANLESAIINKEMPIDVSNVAYFDSSSGISSRIGFKFIDGVKVRYMKKNNQVIS